MTLEIHRVQVWSGEISDRPGAAAAKLELLAHAGADLEFVFTRPHPTKPDSGMLFLAPITGTEQTAAARAVGLGPAIDTAMLRVEGANRPGIGYELMSRLAVAGINLRGLSISAVAGRFAAYLAFDSADVATLALRVLATLD
ncbi:MAG TPA: amino acid-binding ACT [Gemmataceae bacterium]|nr:amino acid-binding ACT [Gemmataceae bacterium]